MNKNITNNCCLVMQNGYGYPEVNTKMTPKEFISAARKGFEVTGDIFLYVPDFSEKEYNLLVPAVPEGIWFAYSKEEIPFWCNAVQIQLLPRPAVEAGQQAQVAPFAGALLGDFQQPQQGLDLASEPAFSPQPANAEQDAQENEALQNISALLESEEVAVDNAQKEARINLFGSSKGGTGKTFTCLISAYRYAKTHPGQKVCLFDADVTDPQVAIAIHKVNPTLYDYWRNWTNGNKTFEFMAVCKTQSSNFPANLDFYLAPKDYVINNDQFWLDVLNNLISNYDVVFIDSGIDYINIPLISYCYKVADRIVLVSTTSIKSTSSVLKQIHRLKGKIPSQNSKGENVYSPDDEIGPKLRLAITGYIREDKKQNDTIIESFQKNVKIGALFGQLSSKISKAEFFGQWNVFDRDQKFNASLDRLIDPKQ